MHRMFDPFGALAATCNAAAKVAPEVMPTKMPSFAASSLLHRIASGPAIVSTSEIRPEAMASPVILGMKSGLQPCIGWGLNAGCGAAGVPSALRSWPVPLVSIAASAGSATTIFVRGDSTASTRDTPRRVPPVPKPVTQ